MALEDHFVNSVAEKIGMEPMRSVSVEKPKVKYSRRELLLFSKSPHCQQPGYINPVVKQVFTKHFGNVSSDTF